MNILLNKKKKVEIYFSRFKTTDGLILKNNHFFYTLILLVLFNSDIVIWVMLFRDNRRMVEYHLLYFIVY